MISILVCMILSTFSGEGSDTPSQSDPSYDVSRTIGGSVCLDYLHSNDENYAGFSLAGFFRPISYTEIGLGYRLLAGQNTHYSYINTCLGFFSPKFRGSRFTAGATIDGDLNMVRSDCPFLQIPTLLKGGISLYTGLDIILKGNPDGLQYNLTSRLFFKDYSLGRISVGCYILN